MLLIKSQVLIILNLCLIILTPISQNTSVNSLLIKQDNFSSVIHDPIHIDGNADLIQTSFQEGWIGSGTPADPYQIDGYNIANANVSISVRNTDLPFIISNCTLTENNWGVALYNVSNTKLRNNIIYDLTNEYYGIYLENSTKNIIYNNSIYNLRWVGIEVQGSENNIISNNRISNCFYRGIRISNSDYITLQSNNISNSNVHGISFEAEDSDSNNFFKPSLTGSVVKGNIISNNIHSGLDITMSSNFTIENNVIYENSDGIQIYGKEHTIRNNTIYNNRNNGIWQRYTEHLNVTKNNFIGNNFQLLDNQGSLSQVFLSEDLDSTYDSNYWSDLNNSNNYSIDGEEFDYGDGEFYLVRGLTYDINPAASPHNLNLHILSRPRVLSPNNHTTVKGEVNIIWTPSIDYSVDEVSYSVYCWMNNDWRLIAQDVNDNSIKWNTEESDDSSDCRIKVISLCSNGISTEDVSDESFDIQNHSRIDVAFPGGEISIGLLAILALLGFHHLSTKQKRKKGK
jgi:parallel beta-helix repeat protein